MPANATAAAATTSSSSSFLQDLSNLGSGYIVASAFGFLALLSILLLASYFCYRASSRSRNPNPNPNPNPDLDDDSSGGITVPRVIFVAEDDDDDGGGGGEGLSPTPGLDPAAINSYPKFPYTGGGGGDAVCSVCLCEYREGEMLRMMPDCRHYFHLLCIDAWLRLNASCPVCRTSPMPTPISTPLSEVVPLSQFAADRRRRR